MSVLGLVSEVLGVAEKEGLVMEVEDDRAKAFELLSERLLSLSGGLGLEDAEVTEVTEDERSSWHVGVVVSGRYGGLRVIWSRYYWAGNWESEFRVIPKIFECELRSFMERQGESNGGN